MSLVCLFSALHAMRSSLIAPDVIRHGDNITIELSCEAGIRFEDYLKLNATPTMASCLHDLFREDGERRTVTIEGVRFAWPVCSA